MKSAAQRDSSIDILKTIGCLVMIVAHSSLNIGGYEVFKFWGGLAPVLFFSAAGVTAAFQARKYQPRGVLLTYIFLFLLGFSFNRITDPGFLQEIEFDIIQMIALGSCAVYLLEYYFQPRAWIYFILGIAAFGLKFILQAVFAGAAFTGINLIIPAGIFPIFPWLFLFFFGLFAYRINNYINLGFALTFSAILFFLQKNNFQIDLENKWDMSLGYFLVCSILLFAFFFILRVIPFSQKTNPATLAFLGKNSLLFLYIHFPIVLYLKEIRIHRTVDLIFRHPYLFWVLALSLTVAAMFVLLWLSKWMVIANIFDHLSAWVFLTLLVFAAGAFIPGASFVYYFEIMLGILTALFYPRLGKIFKT